LGAHSPRARGCSRAYCWRRAAYFWATRARARGAIAAFALSILAGVNDNRLLFGYGGFEHILREIWDWGALTL